MHGTVFAILNVLAVTAGAAGDGLVPFEKADKWGFKDATGKTVIDPIYDEVGAFSSGLAPVNLGAETNPSVINPRFSSKEGGKWGYVDVRGKLVVPITLDYAHEFSNGLGRVRDGQGTRYLDPGGKVILDLGRADAGDFYEGVAPVYQYRDEGKDSRTKVIDKEGRTVFVVDGYVEEFSEGMAVLSVPKGNRDSDIITDSSHVCGYIDRSGRIAIPPRFAEAMAFHDGLAAVRTKKTTVYRRGDTWGYIDKSGKYAIQPQFNEAHPFRNGVARVHVGGVLKVVFDVPAYWHGGHWQLIDRAGKVLKQSDKWLEYEDAPANSRQPQGPPTADQPGR
jgi:hypothetical protein